jgi:hypothetical protein
VRDIDMERATLVMLKDADGCIDEYSVTPSHSTSKMVLLPVGYSSDCSQTIGKQADIGN